MLCFIKIMFVAGTSDRLVLRGYPLNSYGFVTRMCTFARARVCVRVHIKVHTARVKQSIRACARLPLPSDTMSGGVYGGGKYEAALHNYSD